MKLGSMRATLIVTMSAVLALTGCTAATSLQMEGSRHVIYSDLKSMVADSTDIAKVEVLSQEVVQLDIPYTLSTVRVISSYAPAALAANFSSAPKSLALAPGAEVVIRQMGTREYASSLAPFFDIGSRYLLFLTISGMEGEAADDYYVTGGNAGIYIMDGEGFTAVPSKDGEIFPDGDNLPRTIRVDELLP